MRALQMVWNIFTTGALLAVAIVDRISFFLFVGGYFRLRKFKSHSQVGNQPSKMIIVQLLPVYLLQEIRFIRVQYNVSKHSGHIIKLSSKVLNSALNIFLQRLHVIHLFILENNVNFCGCFTYRYFLYLVVYILDEGH